MHLVLHSIKLKKASALLMAELKKNTLIIGVFLVAYIVKPHIKNSDNSQETV